MLVQYAAVGLLFIGAVFFGADSFPLVAAAQSLQTKKYHL